MDAKLAIGGARRADEQEDAATTKARRYVRGVMAQLNEARERDREHDLHIAIADELVAKALGILEGLEQPELLRAEHFPQERAS